jgi:hypothetical protein
VDVQTLLVATYQEGLTLSVPPQINFHLIPNQLIQGDTPLAATVGWFLDDSYTDIWVDAYFKDPANALIPSFPSTMGAAIPANAVIGSLEGQGGQNPFLVANPLVLAADPMSNNTAEFPVYAELPMADIQLTGTTQMTTGSGASAVTSFVGQKTINLDLFIDFRSGGPLYLSGAPIISPSTNGVWSGPVWVRAAAY